ncbi:class I SAM-dependent methyltransferase [Algibacillus agarilyticus]|uniref:class I SAM-dependent methyltransferase n=2 Tax=Algibacillus agarilyticus TaxID=2234133 RepID=UPI000DD04EDD|nr:SAM-dependent methyltransferase [Algibacillus agarilyticus]
MQMHKAIKSAQAVAALRAATQQDNINLGYQADYLADNFIDGQYSMLAKMRPRWLRRKLIERLHPGSYCFSIIRTQHIDKILQQQIDSGIEQVVILGAGYDTRALRYKKVLRSVNVFELDFPPTQAYKLNQLKQTDCNIPDNVSYIPIDFNQEDIALELKKNNFSFSKITLFIWEGVSYYLEKEVVSYILKLTAQCAKGSSIVFDYSLRSFVNGDHSTYGGKQIAHWLKKINEPFLFGCNSDEINRFVIDNNLKLDSDFGADELENLYLLKPDNKLLGRTLGYVRIAHCVNE